MIGNKAAKLALQNSFVFSRWYVRPFQPEVNVLHQNFVFQPTTPAAAAAVRHFQTCHLQRKEDKADATPQGAFCAPGTEEFCIAGHMPGEEEESVSNTKQKNDKPEATKNPGKSAKAKGNKAGKTTSS